MPKITLTNEQLASMSPWAIAEQLGIGYSGDMSPVRHGGFFYDSRDWKDYGYASCVEFWEDPDSPYESLIVQTGVINRSRDMEAAFHCCGLNTAEFAGNVAAEVEASRYYSGIEPNGTAFPFLKSFNLDSWKERNIWKSIRSWIEELSE